MIISVFNLTKTKTSVSKQKKFIKKPKKPSSKIETTSKKSITSKDASLGSSLPPHPKSILNSSILRRQSLTKVGIKSTLMTGILKHLDTKGIMKIIKRSNVNLRRKRQKSDFISVGTQIH